MSGRSNTIGAGRAGRSVLVGSVMLLLAGLGWACGGVAYTGEDVNEIRHVPGQGEKYTALGVVPFDPNGYDPQIAGRARRQLESHGIEAEMIIVEGGGSPYYETVLREICEGARSPIEAQGVVFVTWDRLELRDCDSGEIVYEIEGGYAGIDRMVEHMVGYIEDRPAPGQG